MDLRSFLLILGFTLFGVSATRATIRAYPLDDRTVYTIRLSRDVPTTCMFPEKLTAIKAANVSTKPDDGAAVLLSYQPGAEFFSVRALSDDATGAFNVIFRGRVYVLTFTTGENADRAIKFLDEPLTGTRRGKVAPDVLRALVDRAKFHERILRQYPALTSTVERHRSGNTTHYRGFSATIEDVFRFDAEDVLVFRVRFDNPGDTPVYYNAEALAVRIGMEAYPVALTDATGAIPAKASTRAFLAVVGSPHGNRANLSVRDVFTLIVPHA